MIKSSSPDSTITIICTVVANEIVKEAAELVHTGEYLARELLEEMADSALEDAERDTILNSRRVKGKKKN